MHKRLIPHYHIQSQFGFCACCVKHESDFPQTKETSANNEPVRLFWNSFIPHLMHGKSMNPCSHTLPCKPGWLSETISVNLTWTAVTSGTHTRTHTYSGIHILQFIPHASDSISCYVVYADERRGSRLSLRFKLSLTCSAAETVYEPCDTPALSCL